MPTKSMMSVFNRLLITGFLLAYFLFLSVNLQPGLKRYILLSVALFSVGVYGLTSSRNVIRVLMSIELLLNAVNINFVSFASFTDPLEIKG